MIIFSFYRMDIGFQGFFIITLAIVFIYLLYQYHYYSKIEKIVSTVDNRDYEVQIKNDAQEAANLIAQIREKLVLLVQHLIKSFPNEDRTEQLKTNFKPDNIKEGIDDPNYTSYSINKGEQIVLCLRTNNKLMDLNTMMFVVLHELSHICTKSVGHTPEFWENFKWILEEAINTGIYKKQEFKLNNVEYCGITITNSPLD
jgi:predicted metal-dependent hydrolase